jgi:exodeoxyribonuclease VII small subunit
VHCIIKYDEVATAIGGFEMNFSEKMDELDKIQREMEQEDLPLEKALEEFERGIALVKECRAYLEEARQKITLLTEATAGQQEDAKKDA